MSDYRIRAINVFVSTLILGLGDSRLCRCLVAIKPNLEPVTNLLQIRLLTLYTHLQASLHTHPVRPKINHQSSTTHTCLAWSTPVFELYAVAPANASKAALAMAANQIVQYVRREEERVFIIGGAVF
jgi:hypothetical protein